MEQILITGLDGSGKSTIFAFLDELKRDYSLSTIKLPHIQTESIKEDVILKNASEFVNRINEIADRRNQPVLKSVALFSSMLLCKKLVENQVDITTKYIFCERHPLIDTVVYATFYASQLKGSNSSENDFSELDERYKNELVTIINQIPDHILSEKQYTINTLVKFIYRYFFIEKKLDIDSQKELFGVNLPNKIFYLKADPEILMERLSGRKIFEAHESLATLKMLDETYKIFFEKLSLKNHTLLNIIDANSFESLNAFKAFIRIELER